MTDSIRGIALRPADVGDGSLAFTVPNTVTVANNSDALATPLHTGTWPELDLSKVMLNAAIIKSVIGTAVKIPIGSPEGEDFSVSFATQMHILLKNTVGNISVQAISDTRLSDSTDYIIYALWDGTSSTLSARALTHAGEQALCPTDPFEELYLTKQDTAVFASIRSIQPGAFTRLNSVHSYGWGLWQFDSVPTDLHAWLAELAANCVIGNKTPWDSWKKVDGTRNSISFGPDERIRCNR